MNSINVQSGPKVGPIAFLACTLTTTAFLGFHYRDELSSLIVPAPADGLDDLEREFIRGLKLSSPYGVPGLQTSCAMAHLAAFHESLGNYKRAAEYKLPLLNRLRSLSRLVELGLSQSSIELCYEGLHEGSEIIKALYANDPNQLNEQLRSLQAPLRIKINEALDSASCAFEQDLANQGLAKAREALKLIQPISHDLQDVHAKCYALLGMGYWLQNEYRLSLENYKNALVTFGYGVQDGCEPVEWWKSGVVNSLDSLILVQKDLIEALKEKDSENISDVIKELKILASLQATRKDSEAEQHTLAEIEKITNSVTTKSK